MWTYLAVHPKDWRHRPTDAQVVECVALLRREGIIGLPIMGEADCWVPGPQIREKLGLSGTPTGSYVTIHHSPQLQIHCGPMDVKCPLCGAPVFDEDWGRLFSRFSETQVEPAYRCPSCQSDIGLTRLHYHPGVAFAYMDITFVEMGEAINTDGELWRKLEKALGAHLVATRYVV